MGEIKPDAHNYRLHDERNLKLIKKSLKECGFGRSIVADADGEIIAGNATYQMLKELGLPIQVIPTDGKTGIILQRTDLKTQDKARKKLAAIDNSASDLSTFNYPELLADFTKDELPEIGIDEIPVIEEEHAEITEDEVPEEVETKCKPGDIWQLGEHRLMCGDSTVITDVEKLMNGEKADIAFQSPPYNAGHTPSEIANNKKSKYLNDLDNKTVEEYTELLEASTQNALSFSEYVFINIQLLAGNKIAFCNFLKDYSEKLADIVIWDKLTSQPAMGKNILNSEFEFVIVFSESGKRTIGTKEFRGTEKNIVHISKQNNNEVKEHSATFPIQFVSHFIKAFCNENETVLDLFGGSGSTLIACEQLKRKCRMMELDPHYCDVILTRWENLTGKQAQRIE